MHQAFDAALAALAVFLFAAGLASLVSLVRGCTRFRRASRNGLSDDQNILLQSPLTPALSLIARIPDVSPSSRALVRRLRDIRYGQMELVLVLDGATDAEIKFWKEEFRLSVSTHTAEPALPSKPVRCIYETAEPARIVVVSKDRGGAADSLNAAVNVARSPLIGLVSPGCAVEPDAFLRLVRLFLEDPKNTLAVCGAGPAPLREGFPARLALLESLRTWLGPASVPGEGWRAMLSAGCLLLRRDAVLQVGGFGAGELELLSRLHCSGRASGKPYRIAMDPGLISHIEPARTVFELRSATTSGQREMMGSLRWLAFEPGLASLFTSRLLKPAAETAAYLLAATGLALGWVEFPIVAVVLLASVGIGILQSVSAVVFGELAGYEASGPASLRKLVLAAVLENLGYRQLRNLWLMAGVFAAAPKPD